MALMIKGGTLGSRAKWLRDHAGVSAQEAADAIGIARSTLSTIENEQDSPGRETLAAMADYYGVSVDWLASGRGLPIPGPLTIEEARLLWFFRLADQVDRNALLTLAQRTASSDKAPPDWTTEPWRLLVEDDRPKERGKMKRNKGPRIENREKPQG